jgi:hypothetical protein
LTALKNAGGEAARKTNWDRQAVHPGYLSRQQAWLTQKQDGQQA